MRALLLSSPLLVLFAGVARADVPPPEGYVEQCTAEKQCKKTEDADVCSAWHGERDKCSKAHAADGFVYKCKTRGASAWSEVWCRPKAAPTKKSK